jgi:hypothetical protein
MDIYVSRWVPKGGPQALINLRRVVTKFLKPMPSLGIGVTYLYSRNRLIVFGWNQNSDSSRGGFLIVILVFYNRVSYLDVTIVLHDGIGAVTGAQLTEFRDGTSEKLEEFIIVEKTEKSLEGVPNLVYSA